MYRVHCKQNIFLFKFEYKKIRQVFPVLFLSKVIPIELNFTILLCAIIMKIFSIFFKFIKNLN